MMTALQNLKRILTLFGKTTSVESKCLKPSSELNSSWKTSNYERLKIEQECEQRTRRIIREITEPWIDMRDEFDKIDKQIKAQVVAESSKFGALHK